MSEMTLDRVVNRSKPNAGSRRPRSSAAVTAGIAAGVVFLVLQALLGAIIYGETVWAPFHRIAAMVLGPSALLNPDLIEMGVIFTALAVTLALSTLYGLVLSHIVVEFARESAPWVGAVSGALIYLVNFYGFAGLFPWMADMRGAVTLFTHVIFGAVFAASYWAFHPGTRTSAR